MPILTLTTDFGLQSFDIPALKGKLMSISVDTKIVDIAHTITKYDKMGAAYVLKNASIHFPKNTIHFTNINLKEGNNRILIVEKNEQYYICPDNGIINIMFPEEDFKAYAVQNLAKNFSYTEVNHLLFEIIKFAETDTDITRFGVETTSYLRVPTVRAALMPDTIRATVTYIDSFDNAVVNVSKETFYAFVQDRPFTITTRGNRAHKINKHYTEVEPGEMVCIFNEAGYLEIAINSGEATNLLGLKYGSVILIEKD